MKIDSVSENLVKLALYLNSKTPGLVSEIWIDESLVNKLKTEFPSDSNKNELIKLTSKQINSITDTRRKDYLTEILHSLTHQLDNPTSNYLDFSENVFGYKIDRVTETEIKSIENSITELENQIGLKREEIFKKYSIKKENYLSTFTAEVDKVKNNIPKYLLEFPDAGFIFETTTQKPWGAFNTHTKPFASKLTINLDTSFTQLDFFSLASHEAYGGHHTELSNKDILLTDEGRGEHGFVLTYSPQAFISEGIAEGMLTILDIIEKNDPDKIIAWQYNRLSFALQNLAAFLFFEDKLTKEEIDVILKKYYVSDKTREGILGFSTDTLYGKYSPIYFSAYNFISNLFLKTKNKDDLIKTVFTQPCTPNILIKEFGD